VLSSGIYSLYVEQNGCLSNQASVQVIVNPLPGLFLSSDTTICNGDTISLFANGGSSIQWAPDYALSDPLSYNPACFPENSTLYTATVTDANTCTQTGNILVNVIDSNVVYVTNTMHIVVGENVQLNVTYNQGGSTILWSPADGLSCTTCPSPYAQPMETTEYTVMLMDTLGCFTSYGTVLIEVMEEYTMDVPSAFTPNGDGDNDIVYVRGWGLKKLIQFDIFNRWGELIFSSDDLNRGWDGTFKGVNQNIETYVYVAKAETYNGLILEKHGYIELLR
jgi:gliding motility-associated-like protein